MSLSICATNPPRTAEVKAAQRARSRRRSRNRRQSSDWSERPARELLTVLVAADATRRDAGPRDDLRAFCARACGVNYHAVDRGGVFDYEVRTRQPEPGVYHPEERPYGREVYSPATVTGNERYLQRLAAQPDIAVSDESPREEWDRYFLQKVARARYGGGGQRAV